MTTTTTTVTQPDSQKHLQGSVRGGDKKYSKGTYSKLELEFQARMCSVQEKEWQE